MLRFLLECFLKQEGMKWYSRVRWRLNGCLTSKRGFPNTEILIVTLLLIDWPFFHSCVWLFLVLTTWALGIWLLLSVTKPGTRFHHHHHHDVRLARISLTLSLHVSLSFIAFGRSSGLHPVSSHICFMNVRAGRPAFDWPYAGVHRSTSLTISSLLLQQCLVCLVRLACIGFRDRW